jgi:hypothetical protein
MGIDLINVNGVVAEFCSSVVDEPLSFLGECDLRGRSFGLASRTCLGRPGLQFAVILVGQQYKSLPSKIQCLHWHMRGSPSDYLAALYP